MALTAKRASKGKDQLQDDVRNADDHTKRLNAHVGPSV